MRLNPYLSFRGNCGEAFRFYEKVLGGKITFLITCAESPMAAQTPPERQNDVLHVSLAVGDFLLQGSDVPPEQYRKPAGISVTIALSDVAAAERIYRELSEGGTVELPLQETFWAKRFAVFTDRYGTPWLINCTEA